MADLHLTLAHTPGWMMYPALATAAVLAWWSYRRYGPAPAGLAGIITRSCRAGAVALLALALTGPSCVRTTTWNEGGNLAIAVDRSGSMARADGPQASPRHAIVARLNAALSEHRPDLNPTWYSIGDGTLTITAAEAAEPPSGTRSQLGDDLHQLCRDHNPDAVIVVSDGRISDGSSSLAASGRSLARAGIPRAGIWTLAVGGTTIDPSLSLADVRCPDTLPLGEQVPVAIRIQGRQLDDRPLTLRTWIGDSLVNEQQLNLPSSGDDPLGSATTSALVPVRFADEGRHRLRVEVTCDDLSHSYEQSVTVNARRLRVLMLLDRPRYEMRYLRNALIRDLTIEVHSYLGDGRWRRWGDSDHGPEQLPLLDDQLADYDAIILGDIDAGHFNAEQLDALSRAVRQAGCGLIVVPGSRGALATYSGTALAAVL
ncbi:MAG: hypothetical protein ACYTF0_03140, partial [Planctomycetota bacterium]